ncbi:MAG: hypothetical protein HY901_20045 [Deltaproteobacteria bacterium]|nr:hypothetical protein [Deltaproteobacteria bacterium]
MDRNQLIFLGMGMALATAAIGVSAARRALQEQDEAHAQAQVQAQMDRLTPLPHQDSPRRDLPQRTETVGSFRVRVREGGHATLLSAGGEFVAEVSGYQGAREVPQVRLLGDPVVELAGKSCEDPCNPSVVLVAVSDGEPVQVLAAAGVPRLEDLDGDGTPEALIDHLMSGTSELVTLPYAFDGRFFRPAYSRFPEGVDRQIEALSGSASRLCTWSFDDECRAQLTALLGLSAFRSPQDAGGVVERLRTESKVKKWASNGGRIRNIVREIAMVAGR